MDADQSLNSTTSPAFEGREAWRQPTPSDVVLSFVHLSDTHINPNPAYNIPEADYTPVEGARALVAQINALPFAPDFVLHTGDIAYNPDPDAYALAREILGQIRYPTYYLRGNHDDAQALQRVAAGSAEARDPFDYEFEVNGVQIVCLDSNRPARYAGGSVSDAQLDWLRAVCSASDPRPLVVAVHHNVLPMGSPFWDTFMRMDNGEAFHQALLPARDRLRGVFFGHVHQNTSTVRDGILYSSVLSSWYQLHTYPGLAAIVSDRADPGFAVVTLTRTQTFIRYYRFDKPGERR